MSILFEKSIYNLLEKTTRNEPLAKTNKKVHSQCSIWNNALANTNEVLDY